MSLVTLVPAKVLAMTATSGLIVLGGGATAAFAGDLPAPLQTVAHRTLGAPAPALAADEAGAETPESGDPATEDPASTDDPTATEEPTSTDDPASTEDPEADGTPSATPVGPDGTGPAAYGLCTAYTHGGLAPSSVAYGNLAVAAGGEEGLTDYCDAVIAAKKGVPADTGGDATDDAAGDPSGDGTEAPDAVAPSSAERSHPATTVKTKAKAKTKTNTKTNTKTKATKRPHGRPGA